MFHIIFIYRVLMYYIIIVVYNLLLIGINFIYLIFLFVLQTNFILKTFIKQKLKILLIGRKHLVRQLGSDFDFIKKNVNIFFADDL